MGRQPDAHQPVRALRDTKMGRTCSVCGHQDRAAIDAALVSGAPLRDIALQNGVGHMALQRHKEHIPAAITQAAEAKAEAQALDVVKQLKAINATAVAILAEARALGDRDTALKAMDRIHRQIELQAKLLGDIQEGTTVNIVLSPQWITLRTVIVRALVPYPEARVAVAAALARVEGNGHG